MQARGRALQSQKEGTAWCFHELAMVQKLPFTQTKTRVTRFPAHCARNLKTALLLEREHVLIFTIDES